MRISKKILAGVLAALMAISMMPFTALGLEGSGQDPIVGPGSNPDIFGTSNVAEVNGTQYETLGAAILAANAGDTITLLDDVVTDTPIVVSADKDIKFDLNGHSISGNIADSDGKKLIQVSGTLEFVGNNGGCIYNTNVAGQGHAACQALTGGTVIVNAPITFGDSDEIRDNANNTNRGCGIQNNGGTLIINDGYYTAIDANYTTGAWAYAILNCAGETTVNNATVYGNALHGALGCEEGTFTVNGGTFAVNGANNYYSLYADGGDFIVNGGTFTDNSKNGVNYVGTDSEINISGGTFTYSSTTPFVQKNSKSNPVVTGGTFSGNVNAYCAEGATQDSNGTVAQTYVAKVGSTYYETLEEAAEAATAGQTITLIADVDLTAYARSEAHKINLSGMVLDLDGHTISNKNKGVVFVGDNFTVKNGNMVCVNDPSFTSYKPDNSYGIMIWPEDGDDVHDTVADPSENVVLENLNVTGGINCFGANVTIKGENTNVAGTAYYAVWANAYTTIDIEDGTFTTTANRTTSTIGAGVETGKGAINVKGGNFTVESGKVLVHDNTSKDRVIISGGSYHYANGNVYTVLAANIANGYVQDMSTGEVYANNAVDTMSITVEDNIDLNIYVADPTNEIKTITYSYNGAADKQQSYDEVSKTVAAKKNADGKINLSVDLAPAQIMDDITVTAKDANGGDVKSFTTSVADYCNTIINSTGFTTEMKDLAKSTLDYGKAASDYFSYNTSAYAGYETKLTDPTSAINSISYDSNEYAGGVYAMNKVSYVATSTPELRFYLAASSGHDQNFLAAANADITCNIGKAKFVKDGANNFILQIKGIDITDFGKQIVVSIDRGYDDITILKYTPIHWVKAAIGSGETNLVNLGKGIGNYYLKSVAYFGENA